MVAECGAAHAAIAYPLVGPNIARFAVLMRTYPDTTFYAIGDDITQLSMLSDHLSREGLRAGTLIDVNMGMNRTGTPLEDVQALYAQCAAMDGLSLCGLHCYDGHLHDPDLDTRIQRSQAATDRAFAICDALRKEGHACEILIMGGTPTFPVHARHKGVFLSPGTIFLSDIKCLRNAGDLKITPAAGIWTRVVSHPAPGQFTLDLGSKGISTDQADGRGVIAGLEAAQPLFQSEEHWVWKMPEGEPIPAIGDMFFVVPLHICPATALYPFALVASGGEIVTRWDVTARNRNIGI